MLAQRARRRVIVWSTLVFTISFIVAGVWVAVGLDGYRITSVIDTANIANPLSKAVEKTGQGLPGRELILVGSYCYKRLAWRPVEHGKPSYQYERRQHQKIGAKKPQYDRQAEKEGSSSKRIATAGSI